MADLTDEELVKHLNKMREKVAQEILSLERRIPQYQADFETDGYQETREMINRLTFRLAERQVDFDALSSSIQLVENQMP